MEAYWETFLQSFSGYFNYLWKAITEPAWNNYFYVLIAVSIVAWALEILFPWRKNQPLIRKDFGIDVFYMFFNFFLFSLIGFNAISNIGELLWRDLLGVIGWENQVLISFQTLPVVAQWTIYFVLADFIQWNIHRLLHRFPRLWNFHKLHHSTKQMGFAAHLRFHWMETVIYKGLSYIPLSLIGFGIQDFFWLHLFTLFIGHLNHSNIPLDYGVLRYVLNNPKMHIWHHAKDLPIERQMGVNFGLTLSLWDYIFGTAYLPRSGKDIELGFPGDEQFPDGFWNQMKAPFK